MIACTSMTNGKPNRMIVPVVPIMTKNATLRSVAIDFSKNRKWVKHELNVISRAIAAQA